MNYKIIMIVLVLIFTSNLSAQNKLSPMFNKLQKPIKAAPFSLKNGDDELISLSDFKGKTVLLNFWATWCPPCKEEMPALAKFYENAKDKNIEVIAISVGQDDNDVFPFINSLKPIPTFPILFDIDSKVSRNYRIHAMPTSIIINKQGYMTHFALGARDFDNPAFLEILLDL